MTYQEATEYMFNVAPLFQNVGQGAYKEGLSNTHRLDEHFGHPHRSYQSIHVAGTNGKGSCSHTLAAILQDAGYRVGLYTSPHLVDFRERIRVNGKMIPEERVVRFVEEERAFFEPLFPSFFELATALAFKYFEEENVDIAVIEVGLGGRLDCTNIISPLACVITNISFDHVQFLGNTLPQIASEKAGIIKPNTPVVIGETGGDPDVKSVFVEAASKNNAPILFADETNEVISSISNETGGRTYETKHFGTLEGALGGLCQEKNASTIINTALLLKDKLNITDDNIRNGFAQVCHTTGLMGRWQTVGENPRTICDTGHNVGGIEYIATQLRSLKCNRLRIVIGMVSDKDVRHSLAMLPQDATYYFTKASVQRAMPAEDFADIAHGMGLHGNTYPNVAEAYAQAKLDSDENDVIFVGGSSFIVADFLSI